MPDQAVPERFTLLHLSGIKLGRAGQAPLLAALDAELRALPGRSPSLIVVSGTRGDASGEPGGDYGAIGELLEGIAAVAAGGGTQPCPAVVVVPGRADLVAQDPRRPAVRTLQRLWPVIAEEFWDEALEDELLAVLEALGPFAKWSAGLVGQPAGRTDGLLPGDSSFTIDHDGWRIGVLALGTSYRHLAPGADGLVAGALSRTQAERACGGDPATWMSRHDLVVLVTSDASATMDDLSRRALNELVAAPGVPVLHLSPGRSHLAERWTAAAAVSAGVPPLALGQDGGPRGRQRAGLSMLTVGRGASAAEVRHNPFEVVAPAGGRVRLQRRTSELYPLAPSEAPGEREADRAAGRRRRHDPGQAWGAFAEDLASGSCIAVLGSVFPGLLRDRAGRAVLSPAGLRAELATLAGGNGGDSLPLDDLYAEALRATPDRLRRLLAERCAPVWERPPTEVVRLYGAPWERIYELDVIPVAGHARLGSLLQDALVVDGLEGRAGDLAPGPARELRIVKVNGSATGSGRISFGYAGLAPRESVRRRCFEQLAADMLTHPVVILADTVEPYELWHYLDLFDTGDGPGPGRGGRRRYLVTPEVDEAGLRRLARLGVHWLPAAVGDFLTDRLASSRVEVGRGAQVLARRRNSQAGNGLRLLSGLLPATNEHTRQFLGGFLRGREPQWEDLQYGAAVRLSVTERLAGMLADDERRGRSEITIVSGRAGTGKTATMMRVAMDLHDQGRHIGWIDRSIQRRRRDVERDVARLEPDVVFLDDADLFGEAVTHLLVKLWDNGARAVVAAMRNTRYHGLIPDNFPHTKFEHDFRLADADIDALVAALDHWGALGELGEQHTLEGRRLAFKSVSDRELLVGLMEITRGKRFADLIRDEYVSHPDDQRMIYGTLSLVGFNFESKHLHETELLQILGDPPYHGLLAGIRRLVDERLVTAGTEGTLRVYHKAVGDQVVRHLREHDRDGLGAIVERMLRHYAERAWDVRDRSRRERATMIRLLNHQYMIDLRLPPGIVRPIYESVQDWLKDDFHYWLQRGAYEAEQGDLDWADAYLRRARACEGGEHHDVLTHLGKLRLEAARRSAGSQRSIDLAGEAIDLLVRVADAQRGESPHTYAVLVDGVTRWLLAGPPLSEQDREAAMALVRERLAEGRKECGGNPTFLAKADQAERRLRQLASGDRPRPRRFPTF